MKTRTFVLSGDAVDGFDLVLAVQEAATKHGCSLEGDADGDKIERAASLDNALRNIEQLATAWLQP